LWQSSRKEAHTENHAQRNAGVRPHHLAAWSSWGSKPRGRPVRPASPAAQRRAAELAAKTIEGMIDPAASPEERVQRRRRLTKEPPEFREDVLGSCETLSRMVEFGLKAKK
jgi:hypothetical protein